MVLYNPTTTTDEWFSAQIACSSLEIDSVASDPICGKNFVVDRNTNIPFELNPGSKFFTLSVTLDTIMPAIDYCIKIDKIFAIREFSLNRVLKTKSSLNYGLYYIDSYEMNYDYEALYPIFDLSFTNAPPTDTGLPSMSTVQFNELHIFISDPYNPPQALVSSVFFNFGPENRNYF